MRVGWTCASSVTSTTGRQTHHHHQRHRLGGGALGGFCVPRAAVGSSSSSSSVGVLRRGVAAKTKDERETTTVIDGGCGALSSSSTAKTTTGSGGRDARARGAGRAGGAGAGRRHQQRRDVRMRAIDEPQYRDGGIGEPLDDEAAFAEGTVFRKKVEQPNAEEEWYAGYIRMIEGADGKSMDEEEEEEENEEDEEERVDGKSPKKFGGLGAIIHYSLHRLPGMARAPLPQVVQNPVDNVSVWALATCGFLWTSSTCMVFSLLPVFLQTEFGFSNTRIGAMEGFALFVSNFSRVFSGVLSDVLKSRVKVIAVGSVMTAAMKLTLASAVSVQSVVVGKLLDRFGKGIRAAPTDALIADLSPRPKRSSAYGLHQSMTTLGGVIGSLTAMTMMKATHNNFRATFTLAAFPSILAIYILIRAVRKPKRKMSKPKYKPLMLPGRGRALPSWKRHTRGPLAMPHLRARWRRTACTSNVREIVWHRGQKTWKTVRDWLWQMKSRAKMVSPFLDSIVDGFEDQKNAADEGTIRIRKTRKRKSWFRRSDGAEMTTEDLRTRALIWADDPWAEAAQQGKSRSKSPSTASSFLWGEWNWSWTEVVQLPWAFWRALLVFSILKVARFSEAFVTLHAKAVGMQVAYLPVLMFATNIMQSALTYPLGVYADNADQDGENGRKKVLLIGFGLMVVADAILVMAKVPWQVFAGYLVVGVHMSMTQGNMKAVLSATMPPNVRGTGFAIAAMSQGLSLGFGNYMAGFLCDQLGSAGAFWGGGAFALLALGVGWLLL
jgi:predicted MFS family arabinose efflux permease